MGARQSKRSVDITTTPKKEGLPVEGVVGDAAAPGDGKLEKIEETDAKPTTNGLVPHTEAATPEDHDKDKDEATEKDKEKEDAPKVEEPKVESPTTETPAEGAAIPAVEVTTPTEGTPASPTSATSPESKETKKKDKPKKKWSFRSISFGKKDKNKPVREDAPKNGDVAKETLAETIEELDSKLTARHEKNVAIGRPEQPLAVIVGKTLDNITNCYVYISGIKYAVTSVLQAIDIAFKSFYSFQLEFPADALLPWMVIQHRVYEIDGEADRLVPCVSKLIADLRIMAR